YRTSVWDWKQDSMPTEARRAAPSLCGGSVNSRAILLTEDQTLFCNPAEAWFTFSASIFRLSKNQPAIKKTEGRNDLANYSWSVTQKKRVTHCYVVALL